MQRIYGEAKQARGSGSPRVTRGFCCGVMALAVGVAGCDTDVINPGPVADETLDDEGAHAAVVAGMSYATSATTWQLQLLGDEHTYNLTRGGRNFAGPKTPPVLGNLTSGGFSDGYWNTAHEARFTAEDGVRRFEEQVENPDSYDLMAWGLLYAANANRHLGENFCTAVFDAGEPQPGEAYFDRAIDYYERALQVAGNAGEPEVELAAHAGLAQVLGPWKGQWDEAVTHANQVPEDFTFEAEFGSSHTGEFNHIVYITDGNQWRDLTTKGTFFEDYYKETGDPRARWERTDEVTPDGLPLWRQRKWTSLSDNTNLKSGREMVLIEAEALLEQGQWQAAIELINSLREGLEADASGVMEGVEIDHPEGEQIPLWEAENEEEAWTALKTERRVELWLEGRYMGDLRRWIENDTPGEQPDMSHRIRMCLPVAENEIRDNPNIPGDFEDPINPIYTGG